jgi:hypothetical protein
MTWLRIDDGFTANGKIAQLTDNEFRCWMRLLCHCAKVKDPTVDKATIQEVPGLTSRRVGRLIELQLLDKIGEMAEVHDWAKFLPKDETSAERQARWRARKRQADTVTPPVTPTVTDNASDTVTETAPRARAHTRDPVPSRPEKGSTVSDYPTHPVVPGGEGGNENGETEEPVDPRAVLEHIDDVLQDIPW